MTRSLILVLGDQLTPGHGALANADPARDVVVMAEVAEEASYVRHNRHKIALIFAAMRHFKAALEAQGFTVAYCDYAQGLSSLEDAAAAALAKHDADEIVYCAPGEHRLSEQIAGWNLGVPCRVVDDDRFLVTPEAFADWADGRKSLRMEYFYRNVRKQYGLLLDEAGGPEGGKWNYDADNRSGWRGGETVPARPVLEMDAVTRDVVTLVETSFPDNPGDLSTFNFAVTREQAQAQFQWFLDSGLPRFGQYQDALSDGEPWLFHAVVSMYINIGLLDPLAVCQQVEFVYRDGGCPLSAAEGFIRQIAGWREYVRGIYWLYMPEYAGRNALGATRPLPDWFWTGDTPMRCLSVALRSSLDLGYAHHIQRLMVIGNFCLLAGLDVEEVCAWYLAVYADAFEWVELPNTLGMALHGDDGLMASKPYAASGKYIQRQGDHCKQCVYSPSKVTGEGACPYNALYWHFIDRHADKWQRNARMGLVLKNWTRKSAAEQDALRDWGDRLIASL